ncbi:MAG: phage tail tube protein [Gammaproteobacteria bacterium]
MADTASVLVEGTLYFDELVAGALSGRVKLPGVAKLEIKPNSDLIEATTKDKGQYGQVIASAAVAKPSDLSITISQLTGKALAAALQGSVADFAQGSGTATDQAVTAKLGKLVELGKINIASGSVVITNAGATVTYAEGADYNVNYAMGWIEFLSTGAITESESVLVDYGYGAVAGKKVLGSTVPQIKGKFELDGQNLFDLTGVQVVIWQATLTSDSAVDFMSDKPIELSMKGRMETPSGKTAPYEVMTGLVFS